MPRYILLITIVAFVALRCTSESATEPAQTSIDSTQMAWYRVTEPGTLEPGESELDSGLYLRTYPDSAFVDTTYPDYMWPENPFLIQLVNGTGETDTIPVQDGSVIMIQEARDSTGQWQPIEYWHYSWCGNSYTDPLILQPQHAAPIMGAKYSGEFHTQIRLKLVVNRRPDRVIYSPPFEGTIPYTQFRQVTGRLISYLP